MKRSALWAVLLGVSAGAVFAAADLATSQPATRPGPQGGAAPAQTIAASDPSLAHRTPHAKPRSGEVRTMTIKELGNFEYDPEKGGPVPTDVQALSGMKVRLSGFMMPLQQSEMMTEFALVPSLTSCCYGQPPGVQHIITVRCPKDRAARFASDPVTVEGTLKVAVEREDNYTVSIFEINDATTKPIVVDLSKDVLQGTANYKPKMDVKN